MHFRNKLHELILLGCTQLTNTSAQYFDAE